MSTKTAGYSSASTPLGKGDLFHTEGLHLPNYVRNVAKGIMEKSGKTKSEAIRLAIGAIKNWASGKGNVSPEVRAAATKALAQWEAAKAKARATPNKSDLSNDEIIGLFELAFDPSAHPRAAAGAASGAGGQFVPVGAAEDQEGKEAQDDKRAQEDYKALTEGKLKFGELDNVRLGALSRLMFSFKTSNPAVNKARAAIGADLKRRGLDVGDFGSKAKPEWRKKAEASDAAVKAGKAAASKSKSDAKKAVTKAASDKKKAAAKVLSDARKAEAARKSDAAKVVTAGNKAKTEARRADNEKRTAEYRAAMIDAVKNGKPRPKKAKAELARSTTGRDAFELSKGDYANSGVIALIPEGAPDFTVAGGDPASEIHCTLSFLGDNISALPGEVVAALRELIGDIAKENPPILAKVLGPSIWNRDGGKDGKSKPSTVTQLKESDGPGKGEHNYRQSIFSIQDTVHYAVERLLGKVLFPEQYRPFLPHITAGYDLPEGNLPQAKGEVRFSKIRLALGDKTYDFPLTGKLKHSDEAGVPVRLSKEIADAVELAAVDGHHVPGTAYHWRHGWHPLDVSTALLWKKHDAAKKLHATGAQHFNAEPESWWKANPKLKQTLAVGDIGHGKHQPTLYKAVPDAAAFAKITKEPHYVSKDKDGQVHITSTEPKTAHVKVEPGGFAGTGGKGKITDSPKPTGPIEVSPAVKKNVLDSAPAKSPSGAPSGPPVKASVGATAATDKGKTISKVDAAAKMFGEGSPQHEKAKKLFNSDSSTHYGVTAATVAAQKKADETGKTYFVEQVKGNTYKATNVSTPGTKHSIPVPPAKKDSDTSSGYKFPEGGATYKPVKSGSTNHSGVIGANKGKFGAPSKPYAPTPKDAPKPKPLVNTTTHRNPGPDVELPKPSGDGDSQSILHADAKKAHEGKTPVGFAPTVTGGKAKAQKLADDTGKPHHLISSKLLGGDSMGVEIFEGKKPTAIGLDVTPSAPAPENISPELQAAKDAHASLHVHSNHPMASEAEKAAQKLANNTGQTYHVLAKNPGTPGDGGFNVYSGPKIGKYGIEATPAPAKKVIANPSGYESHTDATMAAAKLAKQDGKTKYVVGLDGGDGTDKYFISETKPKTKSSLAYYPDRPPESIHPKNEALADWEKELLSNNGAPLVAPPLSSVAPNLAKKPTSFTYHEQSHDYAAKKAKETGTFQHAWMDENGTFWAGSILPSEYADDDAATFNPQGKQTAGPTIGGTGVPESAKWYDADPDHQKWPTASAAATHAQANADEDSYPWYVQKSGDKFIVSSIKPPEGTFITHEPDTAAAAPVSTGSSGAHFPVGSDGKKMAAALAEDNHKPYYLVMDVDGGATLHSSPPSAASFKYEPGAPPSKGKIGHWQDEEKKAQSGLPSVAAPKSASAHPDVDDADFAAATNASLAGKPFYVQSEGGVFNVYDTPPPGASAKFNPDGTESGVGTWQDAKKTPVGKLSDTSAPAAPASFKATLPKYLSEAGAYNGDSVTHRADTLAKLKDVGHVAIPTYAEGSTFTPVDAGKVLAYGIKTAAEIKGPMYFVKPSDSSPGKWSVKRPGKGVGYNEMRPDGTAWAHTAGSGKLNQYSDPQINKAISTELGKEPHSGPVVPTPAAPPAKQPLVPNVHPTTGAPFPGFQSVSDAKEKAQTFATNSGNTHYVAHDADKGEFVVTKVKPVGHDFTTFEPKNSYGSGKSYAPSPLVNGQEEDMVADYQKTVKHTVAEKSSLVAYTGSAYASLNKTLRASGEAALAGIDKKNHENLKTLVAKTSIPQPIKVSRGMNGMHFPKENLAGKVYEDPGWSSTSHGHGFSGDIRWSITVPKGSQGISVKGMGGGSHPSEREFILPAGTKYAVTSDKMVGNVRQIEATVVPIDSPSLSPTKKHNEAAIYDVAAPKNADVAASAYAAAGLKFLKTEGTAAWLAKYGARQKASK